MLRGPAHRLTARGHELAGGDGLAECVAFFEAGVDGVFADHPDTAVAARDLFDGPAQTMSLSS